MPQIALAGRGGSRPRGCDFGCGPNPVLRDLVRARGVDCDAYDPLFPQGEPRPPYDFILASEVFEHFREPAEEMARICSWLLPGGMLGVMTERWCSRAQFTDWPYTTDPTHIAFLHDRTWRWIEERFALERLVDDGRRVTLHRRVR